MDFDVEYVKTLLPTRPEDSHKGVFGHVLTIAGCRNYSGAAYFSSVAALRVGCGRSTLATVPAVLASVAALSPDVILIPLDETREKTISSRSVKKIEKVLKNFDVITVGCGISSNKDTAKFFEKLIKVLAGMDIPVVIDADGLTLLSKLKNIKLPKNTILTPHPKEFARLMGVAVDNVLLQPEFWVKKCCEKYNCTTVLKMHKTMVADNKGNFYVNNSGNSALSKGGSGDVLCGMIAGFLASGEHSEQEPAYEEQVEKENLHRSHSDLSCFGASILAVYLHGLTAEIASKDLTEYSTLGSDLLKYIPEAIKTIL